MAARKKKTRLGGVRIPRVAPTKGQSPTKTPTKHATKKTSRRPATKRAAPPTLREQVDEVLETIAARMERVDTEYHEIGRALLTLDRPDVWRDTYGLRSFAAFIEKKLMPYSTARRLLVVAKKYSKAIAAQIGLERGYQLHRLTENDPQIRRSAQQLWTANIPLGPKGKKKKVRTMSAAEIASLVQQAILQAGRSRSPSPTPAMKKSARAYKKARPYDTRLRFDMKNQDVVIRISIEDFLEHY